ncbi:response regulator transcription factor [Flavobacterium sp. SUN046]|uniref:response regulator transcription factor n=1 Tax=Flavobacterium sp. SUN046 TaxID=3002440 RepID=UPI002DC02275|nr:response regulator transcription factor [Flavobacterium sp. SUN046]MEC4049091.1 response regulator transcription factor [Flavobacterium sp. SUN046]
MNYNENSKKNILIFDALPIVRKSLEIILKAQDEELNVYVVNSIKELEDITQILVFSAIVMDINVDDEKHFYIIKKIHKQHPTTKMLVFSLIDTEQYRYRCFKYGASGFLNKNTSEEDIVRAVKLLMLENKYFKNDIKIRPVSVSSDSRKRKVQNYKLSIREIQIAEMLVKGIANIEICKQLNLAPTTISTYKKRILLKTNSKNTVELSTTFNNKRVFLS